MSQALLLAQPEEGVGSFLERHLADDGFDIVRADDEEDDARARRARPSRPRAPRHRARRVPSPSRGRAGSLVEPPRARDRPRRTRRPTRSTASGRSTGAATTTSHVRSTTTSCSRGSAPSCAARDPPTSDDDVLEAGEIVIDLPTRCVTVAGQLLPLPAKEYGLLARLATAPTHVFGKQELLRDVWGYRSVAQDSHRRLTRVPAPPPARGADGHAVRPQRVGGGVSADAAAVRGAGRQLVLKFAGRRGDTPPV